MLRPKLRPVCRARLAWAGLLLGVLLGALQPFIAIHFRQDGWEDEPAFRVRANDTTVEYGPDDRADHPADSETTMYVPLAASIDRPDVFDDGLMALQALVLFLAPLTVALHVCVDLPVAPHDFVAIARRHSGPAPPASPWRRLPPETAPPFTA